MAQIRVLISQKDDETILDSWPEYEGRQLNLEKWKVSSSLWPNALLRGRKKPLEAFLCMDQQSLAEGYGTNFVMDLVQQAHKSLWGANVYIVVDSFAPWLNPDEQASMRQTLPGWFEAALENHVKDILQLPLRPNTDFSKAAGQSEKRMQTVLTRDPRRKWKCHVRALLELGAEQKSVLSPHHIRSLGELGDDSCLVVLQEKRDGYMEYIRRLFNRWPDKDIVIGVIEKIEDQAPPDLERYCQEKGRSVIKFQGWCELYYILQKLNGLVAEAWSGEAYATPVPVIPEPTFRSHAPHLLITHSYVPGDEDACHIAAQDAWQLLEAVRGRAEVTIYPAVECIKLANLAEKLGHVLAWVHIGHGDIEKGLQQAGDSTFKSAEDWLSSFAGYKSSLALALFSSCFSEAVAKRFAESGVSVTIGFAKKVHKRVCVELTRRVVKATFNSNGSRQDILEAFKVGRDVLEIGDKDAVPVAFWAQH